MIRIFIADDHPMVRLGIARVFRELDGFEIVGEAEDGRQVLNAPGSEQWDVLILDLSLPKVSGPEVMKRIKSRHPELLVVVLSMYPEELYARRAMVAGASAYVSKERPPTDLVAAVGAALRGEPFPVLQPESRSARPPHETLSRREYQVFIRIAEGLSVAEIAAELDVHSCTVSNHLAKIRRKLKVTTVADMVRYACAQGLVPAAPVMDKPDGRAAES